MKTRITGAIVALLMMFGLFGLAAPAHADDANTPNQLKAVCTTQSGDGKPAQFCLRVLWERASNTDLKGDYRILKTTLAYSSQYSDASTFYDGMENIDYWATETSGTERHHATGFTSQASWVDPFNFKCFECVHRVNFDIKWSGWFDDDNVNLQFTLD